VIEPTLAAEGERLLTIPQVARRLSVSTRTMWRLISQRELSTVRVGQRGTRVAASVLDAYLAKLIGQNRN
jgi:excisionase family DNA binding protein